MNVPPIHHKTLKRREREAGKGLETVASRVMAKALLEEVTKTRGRLVLCTCHRLAPGVGPRANQGDCKMVGAKLRIFPRGGGI